jgi:hypothetical protein
MPQKRPECCASTRQLNSTAAPLSRLASSALITRTVRLLQVFAAFIFLQFEKQDHEFKVPDAALQ